MPPDFKPSLRHNREEGKGDFISISPASAYKVVTSPQSSQIVRPGAVPLGALAVDYGRAGLVVLVLGDPHLLERRERGHDGAANPDGVLALRGREDLDVN